MYKLIISLKYLKGRLITVCSILFVALGVMALIVVNSVMGGFQKEFKARLRGTLSHMTVSIRRPGDYDRVAQIIGGSGHVAAVAPRKEGLVLVASQGEIQGCKVLGIDPTQEYKVGQLKKYLMTPYRELKDHFMQLVERKGYQMHWRLLWVGREKGQTVLALEWREQMPGIGTKQSKTATFGQHVCLYLDEREKVRYLQYHPGPPRPTKERASQEETARWKAWAGEIDKQLKARQIDKVISNFSKELTHNRGALDINKPFLLGGGNYRHPQVDGVDMPGVLVGNELYRAFRLRPGKVVQLITAVKNKDGEVEKIGKRFVVTGAFKTGMNEYDSNFIYAPYQEMVKFLDERRGNVISVQLDDYNHAMSVQQALRAKLGVLSVRTWEDQRRNLLQAVHLERRIMFVILFFFILFAVVTIAVIQILLVVEKVRDIGILKSMGASAGGIGSIFIWNGVVTGVIGCTLGVLGGVSFALNLNWLADKIYYYTDFRVFPRDVYYLDRIPTDVDPLWVAITVCVTLTLCVLCCAFPAWKAGRMPVVEALKWE